MARSVYLTGLEAGGGKSAVALGVAELLSRRVARLGVFRPLTRDDGATRSWRCCGRATGSRTSGVGSGMTYERAEELVGAGRQDEVAGDRAWSATARSSGGCDAVVIVGTDFGRDTGDPHGEHALPDELAFNLRIAGEFGASVVAVVDGHERGAADLAAAARTAYHTLADQQRDRGGGDRQPGRPGAARRRAGRRGRAAGAGVRGAATSPRSPRRPWPRSPPRCPRRRCWAATPSTLDRDVLERRGRRRRTCRPSWST